MKRILFSVAIAAALGAGSFAGFRALNPTERQLSDIELANVEALAEDEKDDSYKNGFRVFTNEDGGGYDCKGTWHDKKPDPNYPCL